MAGKFRTIWHKPIARDLASHRPVTWLELFYDLVYVVTVAQLAHALAEHPSIENLGIFAFLFLPVYFAWKDGAYYHDMFETEDISIRVFTFIQLLTVVGMAVHAHHAFGESSFGFGLSYMLHHLFMTILWWRTGFHDPEEGIIGRMQRPWLICYSISILFFLASLFVEGPPRFYLWGGGILMDFIAPTVAAFSYGDAHAFAQVTSAKLRERYGLFAILVLGESIAGMIGGLSSHQNFPIGLSLLTIGCALIPFLLWWVYFDTVANRTLKVGIWRHNLWGFSHLFLFMALTAVGAGLLDLVKHLDGHHSGWLLVGACGFSLLCLSVMESSFKTYEGIDEKVHKKDSILKGISGVILLFLAYLAKGVSAPLLLIVLLICLSIIVLYILSIWIRFRVDGNPQSG